MKTNNDRSDRRSYKGEKNEKKQLEQQFWLQLWHWDYLRQKQMLQMMN